MLWSLHCLLDALVERDELDSADAALTAAGLGTPPAGWLPAPLVLQSRARLRLAQQRPADAHTDLLDAAGRWRELGVHQAILASWRNEAADALVRLDEPASRRGTDAAGVGDRHKGGEVTQLKSMRHLHITKTILHLCTCSQSITLLS